MSERATFQRLFDGANPGTMAELVMTMSDLAIVIGGDDVIRTVAPSGDMHSALGTQGWPKQAFADVVTPDCRAAASRMLRGIRVGEISLDHLIDHPTLSGERVQMRYTVARFGASEPILLFGRRTQPADPVSAAGYAQLFEFGNEAALTLDAKSGTILFANRAASSILGRTEADMAGRQFMDLVDGPRRAEVWARLRAIGATRRPDRFATALAGNGTMFSIAADTAGAEAPDRLVLRLMPEADDEGQAAETDQALAGLMRRIPECVLIIGQDRRIRWCNEAFVTEAGLPGMQHALGRFADDFVALRGGRDLDWLLAAASRQSLPASHPAGLVQLTGGQSEVDLFLAAIPHAAQPSYGMLIRMRDSQAPSTNGADEDGQERMRRLLELVGTAPLKELVRSTTDEVEKICIEAALRLTGNNRAAAARVLGLSRQALYQKLERFGLDGN